MSYHFIGVLWKNTYLKLTFPIYKKYNSSVQKIGDFSFTEFLPE